MGKKISKEEKMTDGKKEKELRKAYRKAADAIVTDQIKEILDSFRRRRNAWRYVAIFSLPLNVVLVVILVIMFAGTR